MSNDATSTHFTARQRAGALLMHQTFLHNHRVKALRDTGAISTAAGKFYDVAIDGVIQEANADGNLPALTRALLGLVFELVPEIGTKYERIADEVNSAAYSASIDDGDDRTADDHVRGDEAGPWLSAPDSESDD